MLFSVIIPTYNRGYCINKTIDSILLQNYSSYEIIIIDDCSTDNTSDIIYNIENSSKIIYKRLLINSGPNIAKNIGSKIAKGEYLIFLDSDDLFYSINSINDIFFEINRHNFPELIMFSSFYLKENVTTNVRFEKLNFKNAFKNSYNGEFLPVVNRKVFYNNNFIETLIGGEGLTWLSIAKTYNSIIFSKIVTRTYNNLNDDRLSNNKSLHYAQRLYKIHQMNIKMFWTDALKISPFYLFKTLGKLFYYYIRIIYIQYKIFFEHKIL